MPDIVKPIARAIDPFPFQMLDLGTSGDRGALMREQAEEAERRARRVVTVLRENGWTAPSARS